MPETFWWDTLSNSLAGVVGGLVVVLVGGYFVHRRRIYEDTPREGMEAVNNRHMRYGFTYAFLFLLIGYGLAILFGASGLTDFRTFFFVIGSLFAVGACVAVFVDQMAHGFVDWTRSAAASNTSASESDE